MATEDAVNELRKAVVELRTAFVDLGTAMANDHIAATLAAAILNPQHSPEKAVRVFREVRAELADEDNH